MSAKHEFSTDNVVECCTNYRTPYNFGHTHQTVGLHEEVGSGHLSEATATDYYGMPAHTYICKLARSIHNESSWLLSAHSAGLNEVRVCTFELCCLAGVFPTSIVVVQTVYVKSAKSAIIAITRAEISPITDLTFHQPWSLAI